MSASAAEGYNIHDAKTQLSRIIERVEHGEEIVINRAGKPVAKVVPFPATAQRTGRGRLKGVLALEDDWDSPDVNRTIAEEFDVR